MANISNYDDVIDSRDVISEIEELEEILEEHAEEDGTEPQEAKEKLELLYALRNEANGSPDWKYGEVLIRDSYFKEYAQELAEDCGMINSDASWPNTCIDWDQAARELQVDYFSVDFDGVDYWIRA